MQHSEEDIYYRIALSFVQGIGHKYAAALMSAFGSAKAILTAPLKQLIKIEGMGEIRAQALNDPAVFFQADKEMNFIAAKKIKVLTQEDASYPQRFLECTDAPQLLFYKGIADLNKAKNIAVIGTRKNTEYGQRLTIDLIDGLSKVPDINIISGLAHGIDTIAQQLYLSCQLFGWPGFG